MPRNVVEPSKKDDGHMGICFTHPAFATIGASRISGRTALFGSNIGHDGYVRITINEARMYRSGYSENIHSSTKAVAVVELSEAQWVGLVSRMNMGSGTPCTLRYHRGEDELIRVAELPDPEKASERMTSQIDEMLSGSAKNQDEAAAKILDMLESRLPKKTFDEVKRTLDVAMGHGQSTRNFQHKCLTETKERLTTEAKIEIDAMINAAVTRMGLESIQQLGAVLSANPEAVTKLIAGTTE